MSLAWLTGVDEWLGRYSHIVAALEACSTLAAVIVSLILAFLAYRGNQTKLRASAYVGVIMHETIGPQNPPEYLMVLITNTGVMPLSIPFAFFHFRIPLRRGFALVTPLDYSQEDEHIPQRRYPFTVEPRTNEAFCIAAWPSMRQSIAKMRLAQPRWRRPFFRFTRALVFTSDERRFRAELSDDIRREIKAQRQIFR